MTRPVLALIWICVCLAAAGRADQIDDYVQGEMEKRGIPGAALKVLQNGKAIKTSVYGLANLEHQAPVKPETVFEIGSITKQFTAAGILLLAQDGKLTLDDPIARHLQNTPNAWADVTVRHLLAHTSGIKSYTGLDGYELTRRHSQEQFIRKIGAHPLEFQPGDSWKYSNTGYSLLGYIIENVSGQNFWNFMHQRIFQPLDMIATTNRFPTLVIPNRASGYEKTNGMHINRDYDLTDVFAAGAMVSTVGDLARWDTALNGEKILSAESKQAAWTLAALNNGKPTKYGLGWYIDSVEGRRNIGHGGSTSGFSASLQRFPDDHLTVILLTNTDEAIATTMAKKIATFYFTETTARKEE